MAANPPNHPSPAAAAVAANLARHGGLTYLEIPATDLGQSARFYQQVLDWQARDEDGVTAKFSDPSGYLIGRWVVGRPIAQEAGLLAFFYTVRLTTSVEAVARSGGTVVKAPYDEGNLRVAVVRDPAGNLLGLWQANSP